MEGWEAKITACLIGNTGSPTLPLKADKLGGESFSLFSNTRQILNELIVLLKIRW